MREGTALGRVRGLGSAHTGAHHWWTERLSGAANLGLYIWLLVSLLRLPALDYGTVTRWLASPLAAVPMLLLIVATFWHSRDGLQVVIDDYQTEGARLAMTVANTVFNIVLALFAVFAVLKIAFLGAAG